MARKNIDISRSGKWVPRFVKTALDRIRCCYRSDGELSFLPIGVTCITLQSGFKFEKLGVLG